MSRYKNRGVGGALGIIGVALFATHFRLITAIILLCMIPWWAYVVFGGILAMWLLIEYFTKEVGKDENSK